MAYHIFGVEKLDSMIHLDAVALVKNTTPFTTYDEAKQHVIKNLKGKSQSDFWFLEYVILEVI